MSIWKGKHGPLLIAEIGGNHEGDFEYAKRLTELAIEADVDYIKFQIYTGDTLVNPVENPVRNSHFKKFELSREKYRELALMCQEAEIGFMASVWHPEFAEWIDEYSDIYKIGSGDFTALPVIKAFMELKKPLILSSGLSSIEEVQEVVEFVQSDPLYQSREMLALLQCTSMYPIPFSEAHLGVMDSYRSLFDIPIGYSDHTEGMKALEIAVARGAEILEFHFTDSREGKSFRDHKVSLTYTEVHELIDRIQDVKDLIGSGPKRALEVEGDHVRTFRRAVYPSKDIMAGSTITADDLVCLRPNHGIDARDYYKLIGKISNENLKKHQVLDWKNFE